MVLWIDQGINANFDLSKREFSSAGIIQFNPGWFYKKMKNETKVHRSWLIYCENRKCIYCFPCLLFGEKSESKFCNLETGFTNWRKLNPKVGNHENSPQHRKNYVTWITMSTALQKGSHIDRSAKISVIFTARLPL